MIELKGLRTYDPVVLNYNLIETPGSAFERMVRKSSHNFKNASGNGKRTESGLLILGTEWYRDQITSALLVNPLLAWTPIVGLSTTTQDTDDISLLSRREFLKLAAGALGSIAFGPILSACNAVVSETPKPRSLKEEILSFTWNDLSTNEKREAFISHLADKYLELTNSDRITREEMITNVSFLSGRDEFVKAIHVVDPDFQPTENQWGYTHYHSRKVFIDVEALKAQSTSQIPSEESAGLALLDALWHEWGHLDVKENRKGELLNRSDMQFIKPDGTTEELRYYRGGAAYTDTYYGFIRFEEVFLETLTVRRMVENLDLDGILTAKDYYYSGVDFFIQLTQVVGITVDELYQYHATSDFEGLAKRIGEKLPGEQDALTKGVYLFIGIHQANPAFINNSGVCSLLSKQDNLTYICP